MAKWSTALLMWRCGSTMTSSAPPPSTWIHESELSNRAEMSLKSIFTHSRLIKLNNFKNTPKPASTPWWRVATWSFWKPAIICPQVCRTQVGWRMWKFTLSLICNKMFFISDHITHRNVIISQLWKSLTFVLIGSYGPYGRHISHHVPQHKQDRCEAGTASSKEREIIITTLKYYQPCSDWKEPGTLPPCLTFYLQRFWLINKTIYSGSTHPVSDTITGWRYSSSSCRPVAIRALSIMWSTHLRVPLYYIKKTLKLYSYSQHNILSYSPHETEHRINTASADGQIYFIHNYIQYWLFLLW